MFLISSVPARVDVASAAAEVYGRIADMLCESGSVILHERIFGSLSAAAAVIAERERMLKSRNILTDNPITYVQGNPLRGEGLAGVIIHAAASGAGDIWTITQGDARCGRGWRRDGATFLFLQDIQCSEDGIRTGSSYPHQARGMIERAEHILKEQGASYADVVRTWFYLADILGWYEEFNGVRNAKYEEFGIMPASDSGRLLLPASTGIGSDNPKGSAGTMDLLAITAPSDMNLSVRQLTNPRQMDAFRYGSAFSRGALIEEPDISILQLSGTASIDEEGNSLFPGDIRSQISYTFDKIEALLGQEGARLADICAATVFLKKPEYFSAFRDVASARGLADLPTVSVIADICRNELLFEMDAEVAFERPDR